MFANETMTIQQIIVKRTIFSYEKPDTKSRLKDLDMKNMKHFNCEN